MITFWIFAIAMLVIALVILLRPLRLDSDKSDADRTAQNIAITKERLNELKVEFEQDTISEEEYQQTREELEQALLNDVEQPAAENSRITNNESYNRIARFVLLFAVPVFAISLYAYLGKPELIEAGKQQVAAPTGHTSASGKSKMGTVEEMVEKLAAKLKQNPNNAEGWYMLGRSYMSMKKFKEAAAALEKTNQLVPNNPAVMLRYADALTMSRGGQISGKPFELILKALELQPNDPTGLWLAGMGYEEQGDYNNAISYWRRLLPLLKDEKSLTEVKILIRQAKMKAGPNYKEQAETETEKKQDKGIQNISLNVSLDKSLLSKASADDAVFIFARAANGPPMPLAVVRKQVRDLPIKVILDDSMAMTPSMKLSSFSKVHVVARISKSGSAKVQAGDLESEKRVVTSEQKAQIELLINKVLP